MCLVDGDSPEPSRDGTGAGAHLRSGNALEGTLPEGRSLFASPKGPKPHQCLWLSTPCDMQFSHAMQGNKGIFKEKPSKMAIFPRVGKITRDFSHAIQGIFFSRKNRMSQGVKSRGSLISVPLALRVWEP